MYFWEAWTSVSMKLPLGTRRPSRSRGAVILYARAGSKNPLHTTSDSFSSPMASHTARVLRTPDRFTRWYTASESNIASYVISNGPAFFERTRAISPNTVGILRWWSVLTSRVSGAGRAFWIGLGCSLGLEIIRSVVPRADDAAVAELLVLPVPLPIIETL